MRVNESVKALSYPNHGLVCEQNIDEMRRIFNRKFPKKIQALELIKEKSEVTKAVIAF